MMIGNINLSRRVLILSGVACVLLKVLVLLALYFYSRGGYVRIFGSFWASGDAIAHGQNPYLLFPETFVPKKLPVHVAEINMNPPALLPFFQIFALLELWKAASVWAVISAALYILPVLALIRQISADMDRQIAWLFLMPCAMNALSIGQIYNLMFALSACAWIALKKDRPILAGILIGFLAAMKPPFILWPAYLFLARHFRIALVAGVVAVLLSLLPVILYGPNIYAEWLAAVASDKHAMIFPHEVSLNGFFLRAGFQPVGVVLSGMLLLASSISVWIKRPDVFSTAAIALTVALLCSPLAWIDYVLVLIPVFIASPWDRKMTGVAVLLLVPPEIAKIAIGGSAWMLTLCGMIFLLPILILATEYISRPYRSVPVAQQG